MLYLGIIDAAYLNSSARFGPRPNACADVGSLRPTLQQGLAVSDQSRQLICANNNPLG
jgi:hypothetical protein